VKLPGNWGIAVTLPRGGKKPLFKKRKKKGAQSAKLQREGARRRRSWKEEKKTQTNLVGRIARGKKRESKKVPASEVRAVVACSPSGLFIMGGEKIDRRRDLSTEKKPSIVRTKESEHNSKKERTPEKKGQTRG